MSNAHDIEHLLEHPEDVDFSDPDKLVAMANGEQVEEETDAGDDHDSEQSALAQAAEGGQASDNGQDEGKDKDDEGQNEDRSPVASKNGEHTIPYEVLEGTRNALNDAESKLESQTAEIERLRAELETGKADADASSESSIDTDSVDGDKSVEDNFKSIYGMSSEEFRHEYGDDLTEANIRSTEKLMEIDDLKSKIDVLMGDRSSQAEDEATKAAETVQSVIDSIPSLANIQANDPILWKAAVDIDNELKSTNADMSMEDRFKKVAERLNLPTTQPQKASGNTDDDPTHVPMSMSDLPGGSPPSQSYREEIESMAVEDIGNKMIGMTPAEQEAWLNSL